MKTFMLMLMTIMLIATTQTALGDNYRHGSYYSQRGEDYACGQCYHSSWGHIKDCSYRDWHSDYQTVYGYVWGNHGWHLQLQTRTWWSYDEEYRTLPCH